MKKELLFLEDNGYYWISVYQDEPEIGQYSKIHDGFSTNTSVGAYDIRNCRVLSDIILRPTK